MSLEEFPAACQPVLQALSVPCNFSAQGVVWQAARSSSRPGANEPAALVSAIRDQQLATPQQPRWVDTGVRQAEKGVAGRAPELRGPEVVGRWRPARSPHPPLAGAACWLTGGDGGDRLSERVDSSGARRGGHGFAGRGPTASAV